MAALVVEQAEERRVAIVADDVMVNRVLLGKMVAALGFEVIEVANGREAVEACRHNPPDIVFMDVMMPHVDGLMATREIKSLPGQSGVPVIFVTAVSDEGLLHRCIEAGGDDFLVRPFSRALLAARVEAALRASANHRDLAEQRDALAQYRLRQQRDLEVARRILDNVAAQNPLDAPNLRYALRPMETLNGDVILAANRPTGEQCFLVGDFTGHGLPAAIGALTVQGVFSSMVGKGFSLADIVLELNRKFCALLPVDRFLSAAIVELDATSGLVKVWNGGMPDILVRGAAGGIVARFGSENVPLGILPHDYDATVRGAALAPGEQLLVYSDGLVEAHDPLGELFGRTRLDELFAAPGPAFERFDTLLGAVERHAQTAPQSDDLSALMIVHDPDLPPARQREEAAGVISRSPGTWSFELTLPAPELRRAEPVAMLIQVFDAVQGLGPLRTPLFVILAELYSNALEHGLLGLDSALKQGPEGFAEYYRLRQARLADLQQGRIDIACRHRPCTDGGELTIRLAHDGAGFDASPPSLPAASAYTGRGLPLLRSLCASLDYSDGGRCATAVYRWSGPGGVT